MSSLPANVLDLVEFEPVEDFFLPVLRQGLGGGVETVATIPQAVTFPMVLVRRLPGHLEFGSDHLYIEGGLISVHTFTEGLDGDQDGARLQEAVRVVLRNAWLNRVVVEGVGHLIGIRRVNEPHRVPDWATSTGPVQYADLPTGTWRYESSFAFGLRRHMT